MYLKALLLFFCMVAAAPLPLLAQSIKGEVVDKDSRHAMADVAVENMYTSFSVTTNADGGFLIAATADQLLEFRKIGYKPARVRIPKGYIPPYFKIIMEHGFVKPAEMIASSNRYDYRRDSLRYRDIYKHELDFEKLSAFGSIAHPFSALSKRNREIWRFQQEYEEGEQEKYIDRTFNANLIAKFTGLTGDSLRQYMVRFRPGYDQLRSMNDYTFYTFIKKTTHIYRTPNHSRGAQ